MQFLQFILEYLASAVVWGKGIIECCCKPHMTRTAAFQYADCKGKFKRVRTIQCHLCNQGASFP
jgi:hypothetical protein